MSAQSPIDLSHLKKYVGDDLALREEVLFIFAEQANTFCNLLKSDMTDESWRDNLHALKGAARGVGAWELGESCANGEPLVGGTPGKTERRAALLITLKKQIRDALGEVRRLANAS